MLARSLDQPKGVPNLMLHQSISRVSEGVLDTRPQQCKSSRKDVELISEARESMNQLEIGEISRETKSGALIVN
jgi:flagellar biosynthesis/type III secretory pathway ATPase